MIRPTWYSMWRQYTRDVTCVAGYTAYTNTGFWGILLSTTRTNCNEPEWHEIRMHTVTIRLEQFYINNIDCVVHHSVQRVSATSSHGTIDLFKIAQLITALWAIYETSAIIAHPVYLTDQHCTCLEQSETIEKSRLRRTFCAQYFWLATAILESDCILLNQPPTDTRQTHGKPFREITCAWFAAVMEGLVGSGCCSLAQ